MEINKKLNIDDDIEFLDSGSIVQASNIVTNNTNEGILNENSIEHYFTLPYANDHVVGYISCSDEFVVFTALSKIYRCKESTNNNAEINTNWHWQGGKVIGAYTYNINKELIISITEIDAPEDVPLKIINLDKPEFVMGESDAKYTLNPEIPQFNLINYNIVNGQLMYRGVYNFFIRFKKGDEYTAWYSIGYPIILHDQSYDVTTERYVYNKKIDTNRYNFSFYTLKDTVNNNVEKVSKNINLSLYLYDKTSSYIAYQIGYIVNTTAGEIKIYNTSDYSIGVKNITINGKDSAGDFSLDDITSTFFNVYNVKTLCNYNNRLYIANYKEENPNKVIKNIDVSGITVKAAQHGNDIIYRPTNVPYTPVVHDEPPTTRTVVIDDDIINNGPLEIPYEWTIDREPTKNDFNPSLKYVINYFVDDAYGGSEIENNTRIKHTVVDVVPVAVGFRNVVQVDNRMHVDKDFALLIPYKDHYNTHDYTAQGAQKITGSERFTLSYINGVPGNDGFTETEVLNTTVDKIYIAFVKDIKSVIMGVNNYTAVLLHIEDPTDLKKAVKILEYTDPQPSNNVYVIHIKTNTWGYYYNDKIRFRAPVDTLYDDASGNADVDFSGTLKKYAINNAVYNFFIHYVYPNGTYTDGIQLSNSATYSNIINLGTTTADGQIINLTFTANEDTTISEVKRKYDEYVAKYPIIDTTNAHPIIKVFEDLYNVRVCNVFPNYNSDGIALYKNLNGDRLFRGSINGNGNNLNYNQGFKFLFDNIPIYDGFIGYFISYEVTEPIISGECLLHTQGGDLGDIDDINEGDKFIAHYPEFDLIKNISGNILYLEKIAKFDSQFEPVFASNYVNVDNNTFSVYDTNYMSSIKALTVYAPNDLTNNRDNAGVLAINTRNKLKLNNTIINNVKQLTYGIILNITDDIYLKKDKELISLGYIKYFNTKSDIISNYGYEDYNYNYNYYKVTNNIYNFNRRGVAYDDVNPSAKAHDGSFYTPEFPTNNNLIGDYKCPVISVTMNSYSAYPTFAKNIKSKPVSKYFNFKSSPDDGSYMATELVTHLFPTMANDLFELKPNFYDYAHKLIANYDEEDYANFIEYYDKTVRRSDVISNESVENRWKKFRPEEYKIIAENKGAIINVIGVGGYLIVHCEHSMFIFNRDSSMQTENKDVQLVIPDAFNIDYVEMFTSNKGYAGIQKINQFVCSNYGYIFYDSNAHKIYRFDEKNLDEITPGFKNLFKHDIVDINFAIDERNERMICLGAVNVGGARKQFSISYSFNSKYWISTHSYWYDDCFNTKNKTYFINDNNVDHFNITGYGDYTKLIDEGFNVFKSELTADGKPCSYIDVTFNNNNVDKVLDYISYIINKNNNEHYSGLRLLIYSNCCYSGYIDISVPKRTMNDYKHPYYRFGQWVMNWFRNIIAKITTNAPIIRSTGQLNDGIEFLTSKSLNDALIVGRYFVVRLVFHSTEKISVNNIQCY